MAVFSRYAKVLEADGTPMSVRTALQIINQQLDEYLAAEEGELDRDTRFAVAWFQQFAHNDGPFGEADVLARAKDTAVEGLVRAGILRSRAGKVRLLRRGELDGDWDPRVDARLTVWECAQQLIRRLNETGEDGAARLLRQLGSGRSEDARALAYRLYAICERKGWAEEALAYNALVVSWPEIERKAAGMEGEPEQGRLL
jgi:putative DNA methylase